MTSTEEKLARELGAQLFLPEGALPRDSWEAFARRLWRKCLELIEQRERGGGSAKDAEEFDKKVFGYHGEPCDRYQFAEAYASSRLAEVSAQLEKYDTLLADQFRENATLRAEVERLTPAMRALESFTPSGSEFVGDVERCKAFIRERLSHSHRIAIDAVLARKKADETVAGLKGERDALVDKLRREENINKQAIDGLHSTNRWLRAELERLKKKRDALRKALESHLCPHDLADWLGCTGNHGEMRCHNCDAAGDHPHTFQIRAETAEAALSQAQQALRISPDEVGRIMHESWSRTKRAQGFHGPDDSCEETGCNPVPGGFRCSKFHADLIPWGKLPQKQKDINLHAFDDVLAEIRRRAALPSDAPEAAKLCSCGCGQPSYETASTVHAHTADYCNCEHCVSRER